MCMRMGANIGCDMCPKKYHQECGYIRGAVSLFDKGRSKSVCWACKVFLKNESGIPCIQQLFDFAIQREITRPDIATQQQQPQRQVQQQPRQVQHHPRQGQQQPQQVQEQPRPVQPAPVRTRRVSFDQTNLPQKKQPWRNCRDRRASVDFEAVPRKQRQPQKITRRRATIGCVPLTKLAEQPNNMRDCSVIIDRILPTTPAQQIIQPLAVPETERQENIGGAISRCRVSFNEYEGAVGGIHEDQEYVGPGAICRRVTSEKYGGKVSGIRQNLRLIDNGKPFLTHIFFQII